MKQQHYWLIVFVNPVHSYFSLLRSFYSAQTKNQPEGWFLVIKGPVRTQALPTKTDTCTT